MKNIYAESFKQYYIIIGIVYMFQTVAIMAMGEMIPLIHFGLLLVGLVLSIKVFADEWPHASDTGTILGKIKVAFLNAALLGYRGLSVKELPWKTLMTWGFGVTLLSPEIIGSLILGKWMVIPVLAIMLPTVITSWWGIGRLLGIAFKAPVMAN